MLVITRRPGESFFVGNDVEIVILGGSNVKIGVNAPAEVEVVRTELIPEEELEDLDG